MYICTEWYIRYYWKTHRNKQSYTDHFCLQLDLSIESICEFGWNPISWAYSRLKDLVRCVLVKNTFDFYGRKGTLTKFSNHFISYKMFRSCNLATSSNIMNYMTYRNYIIFWLFQKCNMKLIYDSKSLFTRKINDN